MNLNDFHLLKENNESYQIGHPSGKTLTVSKAGLSEKAHAAIKKYACGGEVKMYAAGGMSEGSEGGQTVDTAPPPEVSPSPELINEFQNKMGSAPDAPIAPQAAMQDVQSQVAQQDPLVQEKIGQSSQLDQDIKNQQDFQKQVQTLGGQTQGAVNQFQKNQGQTAESIVAASRAKDEQLERSFLDNKIDPNRFWKNQSTGSKIAAGIGLLFSGIGSGITGGPNLAMHQINSAIENDIDAQKNDQSKKMNLWKMNREALGNDLQAHAATQNQYYTALQAKMLQSSQGIQNAEVQLKVKQAISDLQQRKLQNNMLMGELSQGQGQGGMPGSSGLSKTDPALLVPHFIKDPAQQKEAYSEIETAQNIRKNKSHLLDLFDKAGSGSTLEGGQTVIRKATHFGADSPYLKNLKGLVAEQLKGLDGTAREFALKNVEENFLPGSGDSQSTINQKREGFVNWLDAHSSAPIAKGASQGVIDLNKFESTSPNTFQSKPLNDQYAQWAKANMNDPKNGALARKWLQAHGG